MRSRSCWLTENLTSWPAPSRARTMPSSEEHKASFPQLWDTRRTAYGSHPLGENPRNTPALQGTTVLPLSEKGKEDVLAIFGIVEFVVLFSSPP